MLIVSVIKAAPRLYGRGAAFILPLFATLQTHKQSPSPVSKIVGSNQAGHKKTALNDPFKAVFNYFAESSTECRTTVNGGTARGSFIWNVI